jgi:hypothetical protein
MVLLSEQAEFTVLVVIFIVVVIPALITTSLNNILGRLMPIIKIFIPVLSSLTLCMSCRRLPPLYLKLKTIILVLRDFYDNDKN